MRRAYKYIAILQTNVTQPLVFTTLTNAVPGGTSGAQNYAVGDSSLFDEGDWVIIGSQQGQDEERVLINAIPDGTHIQVQQPAGNGLFIAHNANVFVRPAIGVASLYVQAKDGNLGDLFIGTQGVLTDGTKAIKKMTKVAAAVQPNDFSDSPSTDCGPNPQDLGEYWIAGTATDSYLASYTKI